MAKFTLDEFVHLGIDKGPEYTTWQVAADPEYEHIYLTVKTNSSDPLVLNNPLKIEHVPLDEFNVPLVPNSILETFNSGQGIYWNGDSPLYVKCQLTMNGKDSKWFKNEWHPNHTIDGEIIPPTNPIDWLDLDKYKRAT